MAIVSSTKGRYYEVLVERGISRGAFFFFSSRRRHTRYWRDWSSDVCSSDLESLPHNGATIAMVAPDAPFMNPAQAAAFSGSSTPSCCTYSGMKGTTNMKAVVARSWETRSTPKDSRPIASGLSPCRRFISRRSGSLAPGQVDPGQQYRRAYRLVYPEALREEHDARDDAG